MYKFNVGDSVVSGGTASTIKRRYNDGGINYYVVEGVAYSEDKVRPYKSKAFVPTEGEVKQIKTIFPFAKKGNIEIIYNRGKMFVFKVSYSKQIAYGKFFNGTYSSLTESQYKYFETHI